MTRLMSWRTAGAVAHDLAALCMAWWLAFALRYSSVDLVPVLREHAVTLAAVVVVEMLVLMSSGLYRTVWRYVGIGDLRRMMVAICVGALLVPLVQVLVAPGQTVPRSTLFLHPLLLAFMMAGSRMLYRMWHDHLDSRATSRTS